MLSFNWTNVIWSDEEVVHWTKSDWEEDWVTDNVMTRRSKITLTTYREFCLRYYSFSVKKSIHMDDEVSTHYFVCDENNWDVCSDTSRKTTDGQEQSTSVINRKSHHGDVRMCILVRLRFTLHRCWSVHVSSRGLLIYPSWLSQSLGVQSLSKLHPSHRTPYICIIWTRELLHLYSHCLRYLKILMVTATVFYLFQII